MTKIHIVSDIHLEFGYWDSQFDFNKVDYSIFAGDIGVGIEGIEYIKSLAVMYPNTKFVYVLGNHEYYDNDLNIVHDIRKIASEFHNIIFLENEISDQSDFVFYGGTKWTNFLNENPLHMEYARFGMNDYRCITTNGRKLLPSDTVYIQKEFLFGLENAKQLANSLDKKLIVVSHHAPSELSVKEKYKFYELSPAYYDNLDYCMDETVPLWIHGHMHDSFDYYIGNTRVICNPRGYHGYSENKNFNKHLTVEV